MKKVMIMCSGLGHINRGYESFSRELFAELSTANIYDVLLLKGAGPTVKNDISLSCLKRNSKFASRLSKLLGVDKYDLEQYSFFISSIPQLLRFRPTVIIYSDFILGVLLWYFRKYLHLNYKLLFSNGAPNGPPFSRCDHVQQLLPCHYNLGLQGGTLPEKQSIIPYGIKLNEQEINSQPDKPILRKKLNLPLDKSIIISVGAINQSHKRMKYLIDEFDQIQDEGYFLLILGQQTDETPEIIEFANEKLKKGSYLITSVSQEKIVEYYQASDIFVLCSLTEGLPRVSIEAMSQGLPIVIHDYQIARETLGDNAYYIDMSQKTSLSVCIKQLKNQSLDKIRQKRIAFELYSWEKLFPLYMNMINKVADLKTN